MRRPLLVAVAAALVGCDLGPGPGRDVTEATFTFPTSLEGWQPRAFDVTIGGDEIDWAVERSEERSIVGPASVRFFADNRTDAAKLIIQRRVTLEANADYDIRIEFFFATQDGSDVNLWRVIAGARQAAPQAGSDLVPLAQDETAAGPPGGSGYTWQRRTYQSAVRADANGDVYLVIGIWGTSEFTRTYFVDDVRIVFTRL